MRTRRMEEDREYEQTCVVKIPHKAQIYEQTEDLEDVGWGF